MLGRTIIRHSSGHDVSAAVRQLPTVNDGVRRILVRDYSDISKIRSVVHRFDIVINCIAERLLEKCASMPDSAYMANVDIPHNLARACADEDAYLIHISTDYVFCGSNNDPAHYPESPVNPLSVYGITKHLAECRVRRLNPGACILRIPVLYTDDLRSLDESSISILARRIMNRTRPVIEDHSTIRYPVMTCDVARFILDTIIRHKPSGIVHFSNHEGFTKWEQSLIISDILNYTLPPESRPVSLMASTDRPEEIRLCDDRIGRGWDVPNMTPFREGVRSALMHLTHPRPFSTNQERLCLIIDLDNTLIRTWPLTYRSYKHGWESTQGTAFPFHEEEFYHILWKENIATHLQTRFDISDWDALIRHKTDYGTTHAGEAILMSGAQELLEWISLFGIRHCVVTNSGKRTVDALIRHHPILGFIQNWVTKEDVLQPKPSPDGYRLAIERIGVSSDDVVVGFEDSLIGYEALSQVVSRIFIVISPDAKDESFFKTKDVFMIDNLKQFLDP